MKSNINVFIEGLGADEVIELQQAITQKAEEAKQDKAVELFLSIEKTLDDNGLKVKDVVALEQMVKGLRKRKFTDGKGNYWSGRGKRPKWVSDHIGEDGDIESLKYESDNYMPLNKR